jgi:hypothetical protein
MIANRELVLRTWPRAGSFKIGRTFVIVPDRKTEYDQDIIGEGSTRATAWADAAQRLVRDAEEFK